MSCDCTSEINKINCKIDALTYNQDQVWKEVFEPGPVYSVYFAADCGKASEASVLNLARYLLAEYNKDNDAFLGFFAGGDLNYPSGAAATIDANLFPFLFLLNAEKYFPALGNHDLDDALLGTVLTSKFNYLPDNGPSEASKNRTYFVDFTDKINAVFFVFDCGYRTSTLDEEEETAMTDFVGVDSVANMRDWFYSTIASLGARVNIPVMHMPYATSEDSDPMVANDRYFPEFNFDFSENKIPILLNGHAHVDFHIRVQKNAAYPSDELDILNCSTFTNYNNAGNTVVWQGAEPEGYSYVQKWATENQPHCLKLSFYKNRIQVEFINIDDTGTQTQFNTTYGFLK